MILTLFYQKDIIIKFSLYSYYKINQKQQEFMHFTIRIFLLFIYIEKKLGRLLYKNSQ